ncbi:hypothetical protein AB1Y20_015047 [Prymnesium parvum]|uniref:GPI ethanolamine phosphate transferase 1 n=1 Tax=Prymnesium parvum TaxID=97485 RepID=A0AB34JZ86_PRYPA
MRSLRLSDAASALTAGEGVMTHVRTAAYFSAFLGALGVTLIHFPWRRALSTRPATLCCFPYALCALCLTWRLILLFMLDFEAAYGTHEDPPNLFVEAYALVCDSAAGWWWSCMLLGWVTVACPVVAREAARRGMPAWLAVAHVVAAFLGAVSLAFPIFFAHLLLLGTPRGNPTADGGQTKASRMWIGCVGLSLVSIAALPATVSRARALFIAALIVVHFVLLIPFGVRAHPRARLTGSLTRREFVALALLTFLLHIHASWAAYTEVSAHGHTGSLRSFAAALVGAVTRNVCQASISIDAGMASAAGFVYMVERSGVRALWLCLLAPIISPAAALALHEVLAVDGAARPHLKV